jgi:hypothetical protein
MEAVSPVVTVAVPTFQRPEGLRRCIDSILAQDHPAVEIIISDNASADRTEELCRDYAAREPSITYLRRESNVGATANFEGLRGRGTGTYFTFIGDDDWMGPGYLSACVAALEADPGLVVAAGRSTYHHPDGRQVPEPHPINLSSEAAGDRICAYYRVVRANGVFYGVTRAGADAAVGPLRNCQGADLLHVAALAYQGRIVTLEHVALHRAVGGATRNLANVARTLGLGWFQTYAPQLAVVGFVVRDVAWASPVYADRGRFGRIVLAGRAGWAIFWHYMPEAVGKVVRLVLARLRGRRGSGGGRARSGVLPRLVGSKGPT